MANPDFSVSDSIFKDLKSTRRLSPYTDVLGFHLWKTKLEFLLRVNNLLHVLSGDPTPVSSTDADFLRDDAVSRQIILETLDDEVHHSFDRHPTARSLMEALDSFYASPSIARKAAALKQYREAKFNPSIGDIKGHINNMRKWGKQLELEGVLISEEMHLAYMAKSMPETWRGEIVEAVMEMKSRGEFNMEKFCCMLREIGEWKIFEEELEDGANKLKGKCFACGELGHRLESCPYIS